MEYAKAGSDNHVQHARPFITRKKGFKRQKILYNSTTFS